ncbi:DUF2325 domain-containing protein [Alkalihalobacillus deserti]|uniref:DUF2325 domain-containing protein n=1 Tax=Alkalihalobacillus deserti TaxID=2879466 RepID=UPI001D153EC6|nr:DUF2325 domain-containing protein [Alkalihalobacillus deserti]
MFHPNQQVHLTYFYYNRCPDCNSTVMKVAHDLGEMKLKEFNSSNLKLAIRQIFCSKCGEDMYPEELILKDQLSNQNINRRIIGKDIDVMGDAGDIYGSVLSEEEAELHEIGISKQRPTLNEHEDQFWEAYTTFALEIWDRICRELTVKEINDALIRLNHQHFHPKENLSELRRDVKRYCTSVKEKKIFWREVNTELVIDIYASVSPKDWEVEKDIKMFGLERTKYLILHFPLPQELEMFRVKHIMKVIKKPQRETKMIVERLTRLESQHMNLLHRYQSSVRQLQKERAEKYQLEEKVAALYEKQRELELQVPKTIERDPDTNRKIQDYKGLISELKEINKQLLEQVKQTTPEQPLEETSEKDVVDEDRDMNIDLSRLSGKTIGIIGGYRRKEMEENINGCQIIKHSGEKLDVAFHDTLKKCDVIAIITNYISHAAMWEAKEWAIDVGKPIVFVSSINNKQILSEVLMKTKLA